MYRNQKVAFLFPGQGSQYPGMGKDFFENFEIVRNTFEEADDLLKRNLSKIILEGPEELLTQTSNSQPAIYVFSAALTRLLHKNFPEIKPDICAGLSLGEYTALYAAGYLTFEECLRLVNFRSQFMHEACEATKGTMAVVLGLDGPQVEKMVLDLRMPQDLWAANFNCPGQVVVSGTFKGIEACTASAKQYGAKRVLPLQVHGAFHSGLMASAEHKLAPYIREAAWQAGQSLIVMNCAGDFVQDLQSIQANLTHQVTQSVRWEQGIRKIADKNVEVYIEIGSGKALSGFNRKIGVAGRTFNIETLADFECLSNINQNI